MKTVGIIGGLGPETTAKFYMQIISLCQKKNNVNRPPILISNVPMPFALEEKFIKEGEGKKECLSLLTNSARQLEKGGADFIVIPCNTAHVFINEIRLSVNIPVISIIDETVKAIDRKNVKKIGLLSTPATIKNKLFDKKLDIVLPNKTEQKQMGTIINKLINNHQTLRDKQALFGIVDTVSKKSGAILLACTDLQLLIPENKHHKIEIFDTMKILADATVKELLSLKSP
ncbi:MAG: amino acid racemase [Patescibacteria group bacterium]|nr:amino acid racemase [Patescibacteria group bacterium]